MHLKRNLIAHPRPIRTVAALAATADTVFNVARAAGLRTAWSDKHPAYQEAKIAEHGGDAEPDRNVPILVVSPTLKHGATTGAPVETTQIAPTILKLLGLNPWQLQAVQIEHTQVLPGVR